jgi:ABC transporter substrate binding protein
MASHIGRRKFLATLGGAAAWPVAARAQQSERVRRVGVLMSLGSDDPEGQTRLAAFLQRLQVLGWTVGRNVRIDSRWGAGDADIIRKGAAELIALAPDVIFAGGGITVAPLLQVTQTVPIVFANATDPVGQSLVASLPRPGGNATGFSLFEFGISGKWAGAAQANCAAGDASGGDSGSERIRRGRAVGRTARGGVILRGRVDANRRARPWRDRARYECISTRAE